MPKSSRNVARKLQVLVYTLDENNNNNNNNDDDDDDDDDDNNNNNNNNDDNNDDNDHNKTTTRRRTPTTTTTTSTTTTTTTTTTTKTTMTTTTTTTATKTTTTKTTITTTATETTITTTTHLFDFFTGRQWRRLWIIEVRVCYRTVRQSEPFKVTAPLGWALEGVKKLTPPNRSVTANSGTGWCLVMSKISKRWAIFPTK